MFFEGKCYARQLPTRLVECLRKNNEATGEPLWDMVSSYVGTTINEDGYVFRSRTGNPMVLGIKSEVNGFSTDSWHRGFRVFIASSYTPGASGVNGVFKDYLFETTPFLYSASFNGYTVDTLPLRYWINVQEDHVILAYKADVLHNQARTNVIYLGKPAVALDPNDQGFLLASAMSYHRNKRGQGQMAGFASANVGTQTDMDLVSDPAAVNRVWGRKLFPSTIFLHCVQGGMRGVLDLYILQQDGRVRQGDAIRIGGIEYRAIETPYMQTMENDGWHYQNNFAPSAGTSTYLLLIPTH